MEYNVLVTLLSVTFTCYGSALCYQHGAGWHAKKWESITGEKTGPVLEAYCDNIEKKIKKDRERQATDQYKEKRRKSKTTPATSPCSSKSSNDYGDNAQQVEMEPDKLQKLCAENAERMNLSTEEISKIEVETRR